MFEFRYDHVHCSKYNYTRYSFIELLQFRQNGLKYVHPHPNPSPHTQRVKGRHFTMHNVQCPNFYIKRQNDYARALKKVNVQFHTTFVCPFGLMQVAPPLARLGFKVV